MPVNQGLARYAEEIGGGVDILAIVKHVDVYRARLFCGRGGRGEVRQKLCGRARGIRRLKGNEQRGGSGNAIHLVFERFSR